MSKVNTVCGPISPDELGITMPHVHLLAYVFAVSTVGEQKELREAPPTASASHLFEKPITMDVLGLIRRNVMAVKENLDLGNVDDAIEEVMLYKRMGGRSMVECSNNSMARDVIGLKQIAGATGINIICSTGWYAYHVQPEWVRNSSIDALRDLMVKEITTGIDDTGIKAGIIKIACSGPDPETHFTGSEENVLHAAAQAQAETGAPINIHPAHQNGLSRPWHTYLDILQKEGANLEKLYASHAEFFHKDIDYIKTVLDRGVYASFDQFGSEQYFAPGRSYPADCQRVDAIVELINAGYEYNSHLVYLMRYVMITG